MIRLDEHIAYLLTRHDCVIMPGWGALIVRHDAARFDEATATYFPPSRETAFNPAITATDGLLAASVSRREQISFVKATEIVTREIDALRHRIESDGIVTLPRVGTFSLSEGTTPLFDPAHDSPALLPFTALSPVMITPRTDPGINYEEADEAAVPEITSGRRIPLYLRIAASVALLVGLCIAAINNLSIYDNGTNTDFASMSPAKTPHATDVKTCASSNLTELYIAQPTDPDASVAISEPAEVIDRSSFAVTHQPRRTDLTNNRRGYCLVVASLPSENLARKFIRQNGDSSLKIIESAGRYRVYAAEATTQDAAMAMRTQIAKRYPDAWVCEK